MPPQSSRPRFRSGFSLVELLVVVALFGVLAGLLLPVLGRGQVVARRTACASNLRQLAVALVLYANDHEGAFPDTSHGQAMNKSWVFTLRPYTDGVDAIRISPADPFRAERLRRGWTSYVLNEYVVVPKVSPFGEVEEDAANLRRLAAPSRTLTILPGPESPNFADHTHSRNWFKGWAAVCEDIAPDLHRPRGAPAPDRTRGEANYAFADGHVETISAREFKRRVDAGENPAKPPDA